MISGSFLNLREDAGTESSCAWVDYQDQEPQEGQLIEVAVDNNLCGQIHVSFCIKLAPSFAPGYQASVDDYIFIETPGFDVNIPCSDYAFEES